MATYISRTPSSSGNRRKFTISMWVKRIKLGVDSWLVQAGASGSEFDIRFTTSDTLRFSTWDGSNGYGMITTRVFRDTSAWMHLVFQYDSAQATDTNRNKIYVNGEQISPSDTSAYNAGKHPPQDYDNPSWNNTAEFRINDVTWTSSSAKDALYTHIHHTDGYAYDASTFGETDSTSGIWKPKTSPSVTYGTNGFFLKFENAGNLDLDSSGNNLTFATSGTLTQNVDTPSNNFATLNALKKLTGTLSNGNTTWTANGDNGVWSTIGDNSGKWYWETKNNANSTMCGIASEDVTQATGRSQNTGVYGVQNGTTYAYYRNNGSNGQSSGFPDPTTSNIVCHALDLDNGKYFVGVDGVFKNLSGTTSNLGTGADPTFTGLDTTKFWFPFIECRANSAGANINFGQGYFGTTAVASAGTAPSEGGIFEYNCPSGYQALCTKGINSF